MKSKVSRDKVEIEYKCNTKEDCESQPSECHGEECCCNDKNNCNEPSEDRMKKLIEEAKKKGDEHREKLRTCVVGTVTLRTNETDDKNPQLTTVCLCCSVYKRAGSETFKFARILQESDCYSCKRKVKVKKDEVEFKYSCHSHNRCGGDRPVECKHSTCCCNSKEDGGCNKMSPEKIAEKREEAAEKGREYRAKLRTCLTGKVLLRTNQTDNQHAKLTMVYLLMFSCSWDTSIRSFTLIRVSCYAMDNN